jgi:hypothetical protein
MGEKGKYTSLRAIQVKIRRKTFGIEEKLDVISRLEKGERTVDICSNVLRERERERESRNVGFVHSPYVQFVMMPRESATSESKVFV